MRAIDADLLEPDAEYDDGEFWAYSKAQVDNAPTITPERKRGRWIQTRHFGRMYRMCSSCSAERKDDLSTGWNYCQYCGAAMQEDEG